MVRRLVIINLLKHVKPCFTDKKLSCNKTTLVENDSIIDKADEIDETLNNFLTLY